MAGRIGGLANRAVRTALRTGARRGLGDGSKGWLIVGALALVIRVFQWMARPGKSVIVTELLEPGQSLVISHLPPGR